MATSLECRARLNPFLPSRAGGRQGVTLIEVVIAIFVLTVGILGILSLFPTGYRLTRKSVDRSIAALAARHAMARIYGRINNIQAPDPTQEPLYAVAGAARTGVVQAVSTHTLTCRVMGDQSPNWTVSLNDYFVVMTSGSAEGRLFKITGSTGDSLTASGAYFDKAAAAAANKPYEPVRVGDSFAIIGIKGGYSPAPTKCFPEPFLGTLSGASPLNRPADPEANETRTMPVATYGDLDQNKDLWRYSYGCILSVPPPERPDSCRLDIFVYSGFLYRAGADPGTTYSGPWDANAQVVGHYVTYVAAGKKRQP